LPIYTFRLDRRPVAGSDFSGKRRLHATKVGLIGIPTQGLPPPIPASPNYRSVNKLCLPRSAVARVSPPAHSRSSFFNVTGDGKRMWVS
jgi:hypothetical protein